MVVMEGLTGVLFGERKRVGSAAVKMFHVEHFRLEG